MNLNAIRLEGKIEDDHFLDLCDRKGILVMAGWCCCDHWERWQNWDARGLRRRAPSRCATRSAGCAATRRVFVWLNGSDNPPPPDVEKQYVDVLEECDWPNPFQSSATAEAQRPDRRDRASR